MCKTKFAFLILPEVHPMDLGGPDQVILEAIGFGADFSTIYCGLEMSVISSSGISIKPSLNYDKVHLMKGDYLIIPGSNVDYLTSTRFRSQKKLFKWITDLHNAGVNIVSICAGAFVLGYCDLLNHRKCTTHFKRTTQLQKLFPKAFVVENELFIKDDNIYTSAGIASGIDLTLHIIEELLGPYFCHKVAREMVVYNRREGHSQQHSVYLDFRNHIHSGIHKAQDYIIEHISHKNSIQDLAAVAMMSDRNFTRVFKRETGITVNDYITSIRKEMIHTLLQYPDMTKKQIANRVGLESEKQLRRLAG